ncbi:hypothetical protein C0Q70_05676 [Pomacea canaliculata]|uniref:3'-5' exonuclease domain-containing protein n=1 Tax=Pomacea canaliculata TaxID=400727 RepID=A0A2T7PLX6_POMCA|nr:uncharacterized protein LOC112559316 isoform X2 [Pomacea canaliculata]PVD34404.1 hypothetical protein C0Q70_05676 [Pomacea canaliculata]
MDSMLNLVGHKVTLKTTDNLIVSGFIQSLDKQNHKITLRGVTDIVSGEFIQGLQNFYRQDILELEVHEEKKKNLIQQANNAKDKKDTKSIISGCKGQPKHLKNLGFLHPRELLLQAQCQKEIEEDKKSGGASRECQLPENCTLVDDCHSQLFKDTVDYLSKQAVIAVSFEGVSMGRSGKLCWLLMASRDEIVFFDILSMGKEAISAGIGDLLESSLVLKVIHDCRLPSDLLYHQYNIKLNNVFDTQVASAFVYRLQNGGDFPRYVESLGQCLLYYLKLKKADIHIMLVRRHCQEEDEKVWMLRPVPANVSDAAKKHVCHLLTLRLVLMEEMMTEFIIGVEVFLGNVRDASESEARILQQARHRLPAQFSHLSDLKDMNGRWSRKSPKNRKGNILSNYKDANGFQENCVGVIHPLVRGSHDSVWHKAEDADHGLLSTSAHNQSSCTFQGPKGDSSTSHKRNRSELSSPRQVHDNTVLTKDVVMQLNSDNEDRGSRKSDSNGTHSNCRDRYNGMTDSNKQKEVCTHSAIICGGTNAKTTLQEMIPEEQAEKQAKSKGLEIIKNYMRSRAGNLCRDEKIQTVNIVMKPEGFLHERSSRYKHYPVKEDLQKMSSDDSEGECLERSDAECEEDSFDAIPSQVKLEQKSRTSGVIGHQLTNYMLGDDLVPEGGFNTAIFHDMTTDVERYK